MRNIRIASRLRSIIESLFNAESIIYIGSEPDKVKFIIVGNDQEILDMIFRYIEKSPKLKTAIREKFLAEDLKKDYFLN